MPAGGHLILETANLELNPVNSPRHHYLPSGNYALLTITDTGVGMTEQVKAHSFEPFFTTKEVGQGTGLGLSTCLGIVQQHQGHIIVESQPGEGTTFKIYFPCLESKNPTGYLAGQACSVAKAGFLREAEMAMEELAV
jgi:signal transduction histidine kinase